MQVKQFCSITMLQIVIFLWSALHYGISIKGNLILSPGNITIYENRSITYTCFHPHGADLVQQFKWVINGVNISSTDNNLILNELEKQYSQLYMHQVTIDLNNTEVQCHAYSSTGVIVRSESSFILLQGLPPPVEDLQLYVTDHYLSITWNEPFILPVQGKVQISYRVTIESTALSLLPETIADTFYIYRTSSCLIGCDTYKIFVSAVNPVGLGEVSSISYVGLEPDHSSIELCSKTNEFNVILLLRSALLCRVSDFLVRNKNLNEVLVSDESHSFTSLHAIGDTYRYLLNISLPRRFEYELTMIIGSNNFSKRLNFIISTHNIRDVYVKEIPENQLQIQVHYLSDVFTGAFISLLKCIAPTCDTINYDQSIYLSIYGTDALIFNMSYERGDYLLYAYDVKDDGSVLPSDHITSYPIQGRRLFLTYGTQSNGYNLMMNTNCTVKYQLEMVGLRCTYQENTGMQQFLLLPTHFNLQKRLILSDPEPLNQTICIRADNEDYYALSLLLNNSAGKSSTIPILRMVISPGNDNTSPGDICSHGVYTTPSPKEDSAELLRAGNLFIYFTDIGYVPQNILSILSIILYFKL